MSDSHRWFMNAYLIIHLPKSQNAANVSLIEHHMMEGFVVPLHVHHKEDETFYILEGRFRFRSGDQTIEAGPGDALHVPGGIVHGFRVLSPLGRFLTVTSGAFEDMVKAASVPAQSKSLPPQEPFTAEDQARLTELCNRNGIEFVGPPID